MCKVMFIDKDDVFRNVFADYLTKFGYEVDTYSNPIRGVERLTTNRYDFVICDLCLDILDGLSFLDTVKNIDDNCKRVILTADDNPQYELDAMENKIDLYLLKDRGIDLAFKKIDLIRKDMISRVADSALASSKL